MVNRRRVISRRTIRGQIFGLRHSLKAFLRHASPLDIEQELGILRNLECSVLRELAKEKNNEQA